MPQPAAPLADPEQTVPEALPDHAVPVISVFSEEVQPHSASRVGDTLPSDNASAGGDQPRESLPLPPMEMNAEESENFASRPEPQRTVLKNAAEVPQEIEGTPTTFLPPISSTVVVESITNTPVAKHLPTTSTLIESRLSPQDVQPLTPIAGSPSDPGPFSQTASEVSPANSAAPAFFQMPEIPAAPPERSIQQVQYPFLESGAQNLDPGVTSLGTAPEIGALSSSDQSTEELPAIVPGGWEEGITSFTYTSIPAPAENVSWNTFDLRHEIQSRRFRHLQITPRFGWQLIGNDPDVHAPSSPINLTDIPTELYDFAVDATVHIPLGERFEFLGSVAPSMFSDFQNVSASAFRMPSRAVLFYECSPLVKVGGGVFYLDREDISFAAVAGISIGRPEDDLRLELFYPRAKIAYRFAQRGEIEHWFYVAQDSLGGGSWAMQHSYGLNDVVTYRDQKVMMGYERLIAGQRAAFIEAGYVYDRELSFRELGWGNLKSTGMIRVGFIF